MGASYSKPEPISHSEEKRSHREWVEDDDTCSLPLYTKESTQPPPPYHVRERTSTLSLQHVQDWNETLLGNAKASNRLAISSLASQPYTEVLANRPALQSDLHIFNIKVPIEGSPITNQRSSGRCWLFASTNVYRVPLMKAYNLKDFELSQAYLFYWDKLEKANWFFEQIITTADEDLSGRLVQKLLEDPVSDGGQWDMVVNLIEKYGLVPHDLYPDAYHAQNSSKMNWLLTAKMREQALVLRRLVRSGDAAGLADAKERFLKEIHSMVTLLLGPPPSPDETFEWQLTPREFARQATSLGVVKKGSVAPARLFSLVNDPRNEYNRLLTVERLGNVLEGRPLTYANVEMKVLKKAVISMLKAGHPVFFGCDVGKFSNSALGIMDLDIMDLTLGFNISLGMSKAQRLVSGESAMTHAMVITGVHIEDGKPVRWRVENSWGEAAGDKGWFVMTDRWMDEYTLQAVVDSDFVSSEVRAILDQSPKVLPRWDPMGVLA
ncbi:C1 family peptidase [Aspergillus vadensis CBS 113365]|uniref:Cysteine proteinase 1, mitochondrial n=1 Tax=Aspergillus vadensis (strain CBS 113365 / IMI 142717 / IBT 24658) TaxID=1448311 RepID=A0A319CE60_ASPVC|nr:cysteine protease [Aspergillus vadensis CBS 113365]PYH66652.1 cysteine protease [Aspergillus vadensis CBS 113365]